MKKLSKLMVFVISVFAFVTGVNATEKNEVTLKFSGANEYDGYVQYDNVGKIQLFKGEELVTNIHDGIVIDLNEAEYKLKITEIEDKTSTGASGAVIKNYPVKLSINGWYYPVDEESFVLNSSEFSGVLKIKLSRINLVVNTKVRNNYTDLTSTGVIDFRDGKEYIIDYTKTDDLTEGLKTFADLEKTLYFKKDYEGLLVTEDETEAVIKIVGDKAENKAIITAVNVGTKKSEVFKGLRTKYTGSKLTYIGTEKGIINEIRDDYYTRNHYEYTFIYADEEVVEVEYKFLEGEGLVYNKDKSSDAKFRIDALYDVFQNGGKVYVDGTLLDSENYTSKSGSTIIILNASYLNTLSIGEHTLKVTFNDGKEVTTKFSVTEDEKEEEKPIIKPTPELEEKPEVIPSIENPKTGDEILTYGILGLMSLIGLIGSLINVNKKNN